MIYIVFKYLLNCSIVIACLTVGLIYYEHDRIIDGILFGALGVLFSLYQYYKYVYIPKKTSNSELIFAVEVNNFVKLEDKPITKIIKNIINDSSIFDGHSAQIYGLYYLNYEGNHHYFGSYILGSNLQSGYFFFTSCNHVLRRLKAISKEELNRVHLLDNWDIHGINSIEFEGLHSDLYKSWLNVPFVNVETRSNALITKYNGYYEVFNKLNIPQSEMIKLLLDFATNIGIHLKQTPS